ncbi:MAG: hypothetical protein R3Y43_00235 [Alphaproteobacteria bacterium]
MKKISILLGFILFLSACVTKTNHLSLVVPKGQSFSPKELSEAKVIENITYSEKTPVIAFFPIGYPNFGTIVSEMLKKHKGKALVNVTLTESNRWYVLFGANEITLKADIVK